MSDLPFDRTDAMVEIYRVFGADQEDAPAAQKVRAEACYRAFEEQHWDAVQKMLDDEEERQRMKRVHAELTRRQRRG